MLKRAKKIRHYTALLKAKRHKQKQFKHHPILQYPLSDQLEPELKEQDHSHPEIIAEEQREAPCWNDSDEEEALELPSHNRFKKMIKQVGENPTVKQYENKLGKMYVQKYQKNMNWAQEGDTIEEKDVNDFLNEEVFYGSQSPKKKVIKFHSRTHEKHDSVISGLDWHNNVLFSSGLDHKIKVWSFNEKEDNPDLKLRKEKDFYFDDLPISNIFYRQGQIVAGTLRKNLILLDCEKWQPTYITSNFLKDHKNYQNMRVGKKSQRIALFNGSRVSILDKNNLYAGSLLANEEITDFCFNEDNENLVNAVTADGIYEWDVRKLQVSQLNKKYLGFTSLSVNSHSLMAGSRLGTVYIYDCANLKNEGIQNNNLVTHVTQIQQNRSGDMLLALSKWKSNAVRVMETTTGRSIGEWPGPKTKVGLPMYASFNNENNFSVGSSHGYVSIYGFGEESR